MSLFYKIFKPVNPILWDGNKTYESTLKKKYFIFFDELMSANKNVKKLLIKLLTLFKESIVFLLTIIYFPFSIILYFFNYRFLHINTAQIGAYIEQIDTIIKQLPTEEQPKIQAIVEGYLWKQNTYRAT